MSQWTHSMCKECWMSRNPERQPVIAIGAKDEKCCFCGERHRSGIYVRHDSEQLQCEGKHEE